MYIVLERRTPNGAWRAADRKLFREKAKADKYAKDLRKFETKFQFHVVFLGDSCDWGQ